MSKDMEFSDSLDTYGNRNILEADYMRVFSPFVTFAGLKTQSGVAVKVLQK